MPPSPNPSPSFLSHQLDSTSSSHVPCDARDETKCDRHLAGRRARAFRETETRRSRSAQAQEPRVCTQLIFVGVQCETCKASGDIISRISIGGAGNRISSFPGIKYLHQLLESCCLVVFASAYNYDCPPPAKSQALVQRVRTLKRAPASAGRTLDRERERDALSRSLARQGSAGREHDRLFRAASISHTALCKCISHTILCKHILLQLRTCSQLPRRQPRIPLCPTLSFLCTRSPRACTVTQTPTPDCCCGAGQHFDIPLPLPPLSTNKIKTGSNHVLTPPRHFRSASRTPTLHAGDRKTSTQNLLYGRAPRGCLQRPPPIKPTSHFLCQLLATPVGRNIAAGSRRCQRDFALASSPSPAYAGVGCWVNDGSARFFTQPDTFQRAL